MLSPSTAAIIIPVHKSHITDLERLSLSRCVTVLGEHPLVVVGPRSLDYSCYKQVVKHAIITTFEDAFFRSFEAYQRLMVSRQFYDTFSHYSYILIYQLDAYVFSDKLLFWCDKDYDYIGAPLRDSDGEWIGVGNGGFSLRKTSSFLKVLWSTAKEDPHIYWSYICNTIATPWKRALRYHRKIARQIGIASDLGRFLNRYSRKGYYEDLFWGFHATRYCPFFRVAPIEEAIRFSVEAGLEDACRYYKEDPPFGCHRNWYLEALQRFLYSDEETKDSFENLVWDLARKAGLARYSKMCDEH
jgi:hypothetical protein